MELIEGEVTVEGEVLQLDFVEEEFGGVNVLVSLIFGGQIGKESSSSKEEGQIKNGIGTKLLDFDLFILSLDYDVEKVSKVTKIKKKKERINSSISKIETN